MSGFYYANILIESTEDIMRKYAAMESTDIVDPRHKKPISISTTIRLLYRSLWPDDYAGMRNARLNHIIAKDFASNSDKVEHFFWLNKEDRSIAEIRSGSGGRLYISAIRSDSVNVMTIQTSWKKPRYNKQKEVLEFGEE